MTAHITWPITNSRVPTLPLATEATVLPKKGGSSPNGRCRLWWSVLSWCQPPLVSSSPGTFLTLNNSWLKGRNENGRKKARGYNLCPHLICRLWLWLLKYLTNSSLYHKMTTRTETRGPSHLLSHSPSSSSCSLAVSRLKNGSALARETQLLMAQAV